MVGAQDEGRGAGVTAYFDHLRSDVLAIIPAGVKSVLSLGCGAGRTEAELVKRGVVVVGVEIDPQAARTARSRGVTVLEGDVTKMDVNTGCEPYDCILYADVLEHLLDPVAVLRRHVASLKTGGIVCITVPNFRNWKVFWELFVKGHVSYRDAGILDRTHIRMTTRKMVLEWLRAAGLEPTQSRYLFRGRRKKIVEACLFGVARELVATQVALVGTKRPAPGGAGSRGFRA
jgi:2-polyprenyl-3-methyl-5-hydroxy-6-metoxy-1,4-benzoquinol methylase